ncbi:MAG: hypothetical protein Q8P24_12420 [Desulfobacterales bacterium]|nr:hypothetical protein [Desulfobacterales bacterium]
MRLDTNPVYRKVIISWYDSEAACFIVILGMFLVLLFGSAGISVARQIAEYGPYIWVPILLIVMSSGVIVSTGIRLIRRFVNRSAE